MDSDGSLSKTPGPVMPTWSGRFAESCRGQTPTPKRASRDAFPSFSESVRLGPARSRSFALGPGPADQTDSDRRYPIRSRSGAVISDPRPSESRMDSDGTGTGSRINRPAMQSPWAGRFSESCRGSNREPAGTLFEASSSQGRFTSDTLGWCRARLGRQIRPTRIWSIHGFLLTRPFMAFYSTYRLFGPGPGPDGPRRYRVIGPGPD